MPKLYHCTCQAGRHSSKKAVTNCYNKKKNQSAQMPLLLDEGMNNINLISPTLSKQSLQTQIMAPKAQIRDETLINCHFVRSLRDQKEVQQLSILQEINKLFWNDPERRHPAKGCRSSNRFICIIKKRNELIEQLKYRFQIYMNRKNILPLGLSMQNLRKNMFKRRRNVNYASQIFESYVSKFEDRRQFGNIEKMTSEFKDLIKFLKGCSYKRFMWILKRSRIIKERIGAGRLTLIEGFRNILLNKFLQSYPRELTYRFNSIFLTYLHNIGDQFTIQNFWRSHPTSRLKDFAQNCLKPQMKEFLEANHLPIKDPNANLPADETEWLKRRQKSHQDHVMSFDQPLQVPEMKMSSGFRPFPGLTKPIYGPPVISDAEYCFSRSIPSPEFCKYRKFSETSMWKIKKLGIITSKWLQYAFDKISSQSRQREAFFLDRQAEKVRMHQKTKRWACKTFINFIDSRTYLYVAFSRIFCIKYARKNEIPTTEHAKKNPKPMPRDFIHKSNLSLYTREEAIQTCYLPKLKGKAKDFQCMDYQKCSRKFCCYWLEGQILECADCNAAYHKKCWSKTDDCEVCQVTNKSILYNFNVFVNKWLFKSMAKTLTLPPQPVSQQQTFAAIEKIQDNLSTQAYCVTNRFQEHFIVYPFYNPKVRRLHKADQEIIDQYNNKKIAFPVTIVEMNSNKGRGLIANRIIQKGELVSTYSGNVVSLAQASKYKKDSIKDYIFHLICGPDVQTNFVVFPKDFASAGFFMNHTNSRKAKKKVNVNAFITLHNDGPIILMQATRRIHFGEELLYDYNAQFAGYDTEGFE